MCDLNSPENAVSVVLPVHNGGIYLAGAVDSILQQQGVQLELIIIDDHSTDSALCGLVKDSRIKLLRSPQKGIVAALNVGIDASRHPFIARMDADDIAADNRLRSQLRHFNAHPKLDICGTKVKMFNPLNGIAEGYLEYEKWINNLCLPEEIENEIFVESPIPHPTAMLRKNFLNSLGGYLDTDWPEDYDLWLRALLAGAEFGKPEEPELLFWRDHDARLSRNDQRYNKQMFLQCKAYYLSIYLKRRGLTSCVVLGTGPTGLKMHDYLSDNGMNVSGFIDINQNMEGRLKRGKPVHITQTPPSANQISVFGSKFNSIIIAAVSARGARERIRNYLNAADLTETNDYILAA